jgi:hypothetical protein
MAKRTARQSGVNYAGVVKLGLKLPGVEESTSYGTPALKVRKKLLVRLKEDGQTLVLRTTFEERERLLAAEPDVFFLTDHYVGAHYVLVRLPKVPAALLGELLAAAWRLEGGG